ncbi:hypothetical protein IFR05_015885 [Cadophora sp. M221]|nr:hypothetical protein IFR05_015885 [Cadophora sp. M221]
MQHFEESPSSSGSYATPTGNRQRGREKRARTESSNDHENRPQSSTDASNNNNNNNNVTGTRPELLLAGPRPRLRAAVACATCRARKTKCNGVRPKCGYCERTGGDCHYDGIENYMSQPPLSCQNIGHEVLQAVQHLTRVIQQQQNQQQAYRPLLQDDEQNWSITPGQYSIPSAIEDSSHVAGLVEEDDEPEGQAASPFHLTASEGLDSILQWKVFPQGLPTVQVDDCESIRFSDALPSTALAYLKELEGNYIHVVHSKNPMLDLTTLRHYVAHVSENGFDWTTRSCLVAIVCAIGAICQEPTSNDPAYNEARQKGHEESACRFWSVASKRLGLAMTYNTIESAQCLCLTGIWFMCCLQPLEAWKHFSMAGNAWYSAVIASKNPRGNLDVQLQQSMLQTLEQSTFYTSYKSELEIRYELGMHGSVLEHIEDRIMFPIPPISQDTMVAELGPDEGTVSWYFYLSDIAARHLINRIVESHSKIGIARSLSKTRTLLHDYDVFLSQLQEWYESLPPSVSFELPSTTISSELNLTSHILRARYLSIQELLCRPFLKICLNQSVVLSEELIESVVGLASLGLKYCAWKLRSTYKYVRLDHGMWISVRNTTACAMMLIGAVRGQRMPSLHMAAQLQVPEDWREATLYALERYGTLASQTRGGVAHCMELVRHELNDLATAV